MTPQQEQRLLDVQLSQTRLETVVTDNIKLTSELLTKVTDTVYDDQAGLVVRLDREEQKSKNITRVIWIVLTGVIGMGMTYAAASIF